MAKYIVKRGDTLSMLAKRFLGDANKYKELASINNIKNPNLIRTGQLLEIPERNEPINKEETKLDNTSKQEVNNSPKLKTAKLDNTSRLLASIKLEKVGDRYLLANNSITVARPKLIERKYVTTKKEVEPTAWDTITSWFADKYNDVKNTIKESESVGDFFLTAYNGVSKNFSDDKEVETPKAKISYTPKKKSTNASALEIPSEVIDENFARATRNGTDTLTWDRTPIDRTGNKYFILESYPITLNMRFGARNRGSREALPSNNAPMPTYKPFYKFEEHPFTALDNERHQNYFMGFDSNGKFKLGPLSDFKAGDTLTQVYYSDVVSIPRDQNGLLILRTDPTNPSRKQVVFNGYGESYYDADGKLLMGKQSDGVLTPMTKRHSTDGSFGNVSGGGVLLQCGSETRLVRGSINYVVQEIERMQENHKGKPVRYFLLDNGSYNRALRTRNSNITSTDLEDYDRQNTGSAGGGHFMYIKSQKIGGRLIPKFKLMK